MTLTAIDSEPPGQGLADMLVELVETVESGKVSAMAVTLVYRDGCSDWTCSPLPNRATMLGAIEMMKLHLALEP